MTLVSTVTLGSSASSIDFTSIPQTGTDLLVVFSIRSTDATANHFVRFNSDSGSNYGHRRLRGDGSSASSQYQDPSSQVFIPNAASMSSDTANTFSNGSVYISNYTSSVAKSVSADSVAENNGTTAGQAIVAARWSGTAAITSLSIIHNGATFAQYSTASLYTITKGSGGATVS